MRVERLLAWRKPTQTMSFLAVYSFLCLNPYLIFVLPIALILFFVMVPAFIARHPPPPATSTSSTTPYYSYDGPALAPARTIKPASETSKDFFRNMRDLQNCMADFSNLHDAAVSTLSPLTNFADETVSSLTFLVCVIAMALLFLTAHLLPWRWVFLVGGNAAVLSGSPHVQAFLKNLQLEGSGEPTVTTNQRSEASKKAPTLDILGLSVPTSPAGILSCLQPLTGISLDVDTEEREVEVFELQHRPLETYASSEWEHFLFSPQPYDPLSPSRIAGDRPRGCRFFEDVQPPAGWAWKSKKWELDLDCREWVVERMITGVAYEVPGGGMNNSQTVGVSDAVGGWVWDLPPSAVSPSTNEDDVVAALGYRDLAVPAKGTTGGRSTRSVDMAKRTNVPREWEVETAAVQGTGEWRRRRWVRLVRRVSVPASKRRNSTPDRQ